MIVLRNQTMAVLLVLASVIGTAPFADAALLRYEYTGVIRQLNETTGDGSVAIEYLNSVNVTVGTMFSGYYVVDTSIMDAIGDPNFARYREGPVNFGLQIGHLTAESSAQDNGTASLFVRNDTSDLWALGPAVIYDVADRISRFGFDLTLQDSTGTALSSDASDQLLPELASFDAFNPDAGLFTGLNLVVRVDDGNAVALYGELTSHQLVAVPVPGALALFGGALALLFRVTRSRLPGEHH